jgi:hypothetical protein
MQSASTLQSTEPSFSQWPNCSGGVTRVFQIVLPVAASSLNTVSESPTDGNEKQPTVFM